MKKLLGILLATVLALGTVTALAADAVDIAIFVPNADHGWTGAVLQYAEEAAKAINDAGKYTAKVIPANDGATQIPLVEDVIENQSAKNIVILPHDNTLEATMQKVADSGIPFVMFDRVIDSVKEQAVSSVMGDNEGIGYETAKRFVATGLQPGAKILIIPGDNSSVPQMRNDGFFKGLKEAGWTDEQIAGITMTDYTSWSRERAKELFIGWMDSSTVEEIAAYEYIFTHDDPLALGLLDALKGSDIDDAKKAAFLSGKVHLAASSGLNEMYSVIKGIHQNDYTAEVAKLADLFSVTYDPGMIKIAIQDIVDSLEGKEIPKTHVVPVSVVDSTNVNEFQGFGDALSK